LSREGAPSSSPSASATEAAAAATTTTEEHRWTVDVLSQTLPELSLVIDLTATDRYYNPRNMQLKHVKIKTEGHVVPNKRVINRFFHAVDRALNADKEALIGVHCTHGVNRTGYLICRYLIQKLKWEPEKAIQEFADCRGHAIERQNYLQSLKSAPRSLSVENEKELSKSPNCDRSNERRDSPSKEQSEQSERSSKRRNRYRNDRRRDYERSERRDYERSDREKYERSERRDHYEPNYRSYHQRSERYDRENRSRSSNYRQKRYENDQDTKSPKSDSYRDNDDHHHRHPN